MFVTTQLVTGDSLPGLYAFLMQNGPADIASGFTPTTFTLNNSAQYRIGVNDYANYAFDHWQDTGSSTNPRPISISNNTQITAVFRDIDVALSPSRGPVDTSVSITGTTFSANNTITLTWDGSPIVTAPSTITSDSTGGFTASFQVPSTVSAGSHMVQATDGEGNTHTALFTISASPSIVLTTNSATIGTGVRVTGTNFAPSSQITISFDGTAIGEGLQNLQFVGTTTPTNVTTDSNGNFTAIISVIRSVAGVHSISAQDPFNAHAAKPITVTPHVFIYPTSGHAGSQVLIPASQGNGFAANSTITIKFNGTTITPLTAITADDTGNFGGRFIIPTTASLGSHQIQISDNKGNIFSTSFTVTPPTTPTYSVQSVVSGLNLPDSFAFIPDNGSSQDGSGAFMVTEKNTGNVIVFKNIKGQFVRQTVPFVTIPNLQVGYEDNGILGIAIDPHWISSKLVYFYVTRNVTGAINGELIRYHATTDSSGNIIADKSIGEQLVLGKIPANIDGHNSGHLKFDSKGNLYISAGDAWAWIAENLTTLEGKILRITPLVQPINGQIYSIPSTNPFASSSNPSIPKEIWAYGIRNPFAFDIDSQTGKIYASDVGFWTWERIDNLTASGSNAGWPNYEGPMYGNPQNLANYVPQIYWYPHQGVMPLTGQMVGRAALTAGAFYHGTYYPNMDGAYFFGDFGTGFIAALLPSSVAPPQIDPASGELKSQVVPIYYGLSNAPINMQVWHGKIYFLDLDGSVNVLNYN